jgi:hypothetical protein
MEKIDLINKISKEKDKLLLFISEQEYFHSSEKIFLDKTKEGIEEKFEEIKIEINKANSADEYVCINFFRKFATEIGNKKVSGSLLEERKKLEKQRVTDEVIKMKGICNGKIISITKIESIFKELMSELAKN